jgi:outer membrane receptor protein involved in Fe transport
VPRLPVTYFQPASDAEKIRVIPGDGFYDYGNHNVWHDHYVEWYTLRGDITMRLGSIHTFKTGLEMSFKEMQLIDIVDPWIGTIGSSQDVYRVNPADGALYLQDDIRFEGFILNLGLRLDYWFPGKYADDAVKDTNNVLSGGIREKYTNDTSELFGMRYKLRLMPRIGVSHPISNNLMLYFNYGHFSKLPKPQFLYAKLGPNSSKSAYQKYGNPALDPETSVKYELGIRYQFTTDDVLHVNVYYNDIFDYVQTTPFTSSRRGFSGITYTNLDYARSRGIEAEYKTRIGRFFYGDLSGSYSITTTKSSTSDVGYLIAQQRLDEPPIKETYAAWDRPWQISANAAFRVPANEHPSLFGLKLFDDWNLNLRFFAQAGKRYTPTELSYIRESDGRPMYDDVTDQTRDYEQIGESWSWFDLRFVKNFRFWSMKYSVNLEIRNLFDQKNAQIVNPVTGKAYETGDPTLGSWNDPLYPDLSHPISSPFPYNPARYLAPRQIILGFSVSF